MSLRFQLLALGALTLLLPWAGLRMVEQVEASLRLALERSLLDSARASVVASRLTEIEALSRRETSETPVGEPLFVHALSRPPLIDGFFGDWDFMRDRSEDAGDSSALILNEGNRAWLGFNGGFIYLYVDVVDDEIVFQGAPGETPHGDRILLLFGSDPDSPAALLLTNSAPGRFRAQPTLGFPDYAPTGGYYETARGNWRNTGNGFAIEARLPARIVDDALGIGIIDSDDGGRSAEFAAVTWETAARPSTLVRENQELNLVLQPFEGGEDRVRILDRNGLVIADSGALEIEAQVEQDASPTIAERFFRYILRRDDPEYGSHESRLGYISDPALRVVLEGREATAWYRQGAEASAIVIAAVPIDPSDPRRGALLLEQASEPIRTLANRAMMQVMSTTVLIILIAVPGLFGYAGFLSFRVGRLARAAETALGPRGEIQIKVPGTSAGDELGDLSRAFTDLLGRLREYTDYLQSLKSKLSHELRTPLAIVATSLDNLEHEMTTQPGKDYLARLRHGSERLESILQAMTAATRVEQAITQTDLETFDVVAVVASCVSAYDDVYQSQTFVTKLPDGPIEIEGSAELFEQMLDKLVDNAVSFSADDSAIEISLEAVQHECRLSVVNRGPLLPEAMRHQLFDSLVSVRDSDGEKPHLGLGLYIVTLVAELHRGRVEAENLDDGSGVRISVLFPRGDSGTA